MNEDALIGYSGFVGQTLSRQRAFGHNFRSTNADQIGTQPYDTVYCCAAPAKKWLANKEPAHDKEVIEQLIAHLNRITCKKFVLISTVDVFKSPIHVDESSEVDESDLHPYGLHRRMLEKFVAQRFESHLIVRLPGLVGPGLSKNILFDFLNNNNLQAIDSRALFQFYPMINLWYDLQTALKADLELLHLCAEPVSVAEVATLGFNQFFENVTDHPPAHYDIRSLHTKLYGAHGAYQYSRKESIQAIRAYVQTEPVTLSQEKG